MNSKRPPGIATWLLKYLGMSPNNDAILGDLMERYQHRRSVTWYWKQVIAAILVGLWQAIRNHAKFSMAYKSIGGHMRRRVMLLGAIAVGLFVFLLQGQAQVAIRAASADPVTGWERMQFAEGSRSVWVAPTTSLAATDIERARSYTTPEGRTAVAIVFTEAGAKKMRDLSAAQLNKLIAVVVDGKLIWAPLVRSEISNEASITGNGPNGVPKEIVDRILASVGQR